MFQKIASICSIGSFLVGIYIILAGHPKWQWYSLFGIGSLLIIVGLIGRKHKLGGPGKMITLEGVQPLPYSANRKIEIEVFYPKTFKRRPNLTPLFDRARAIPEVGAGVDRPWYKITEQRPDGFKCEIYELPAGYKPIIKWRAKGELETDSSKLSQKKEGYIGGRDPTG